MLVFDQMALRSLSSSSRRGLRLLPVMAELPDRSQQAVAGLRGLLQ
jgi:hypothetical protein